MEGIEYLCRKPSDYLEQYSFSSSLSLKSFFESSIGLSFLAEMVRLSSFSLEFTCSIQDICRHLNRDIYNETGKRTNPNSGSQEQRKHDGEREKHANGHYNVKDISYRRCKEIEEENNEGDEKEHEDKKETGGCGRINNVNDKEDKKKQGDKTDDKKNEGKDDGDDKQNDNGDREGEEKENEDDVLNLNFQCINGRQFKLQVPRNILIKDIIFLLEDDLGVTSDRVRLIFHGRNMQPSHVLSSYRIESGNTIHVVIRPQISYSTVSQSDDTQVSSNGHDTQNTTPDLSMQSGPVWSPISFPGGATMMFSQMQISQTPDGIRNGSWVNPDVSFNIDGSDFFSSLMNMTSSSPLSSSITFPTVAPPASLPQPIPLPSSQERSLSSPLELSQSSESLGNSTHSDLSISLGNEANFHDRLANILLISSNDLHMQGNRLRRLANQVRPSSLISRSSPTSFISSSLRQQPSLNASQISSSTLHNSSHSSPLPSTSSSSAQLFISNEYINDRLPWSQLQQLQLYINRELGVNFPPLRFSRQTSHLQLSPLQLSSSPPREASTIPTTSSNITSAFRMERPITCESLSTSTASSSESSLSAFSSRSTASNMINQLPSFSEQSATGLFSPLSVFLTQYFISMNYVHSLLNMIVAWQQGTLRIGVPDIGNMASCLGITSSINASLAALLSHLFHHMIHCVNRGDVDRAMNWRSGDSEFNDSSSSLDLVGRDGVTSSDITVSSSNAVCSSSNAPMSSLSSSETPSALLATSSFGSTQRNPRAQNMFGIVQSMMNGLSSSSRTSLATQSSSSNDQSSLTSQTSSSPASAFPVSKSSTLTSDLTSLTPKKRDHSDSDEDENVGCLTHSRHCSCPDQSLQRDNKIRIEAKENNIIKEKEKSGFHEDNREKENKVKQIPDDIRCRFERWAQSPAEFSKSILQYAKPFPFSLAYQSGDPSVFKSTRQGEPPSICTLLALRWHRALSSVDSVDANHPLYRIFSLSSTAQNDSLSTSVPKSDTTAIINKSNSCGYSLPTPNEDTSVNFSQPSGTNLSTAPSDLQEAFLVRQLSDIHLLIKNNPNFVAEPDRFPFLKELNNIFKELDDEI